jgi:hypothetical protein
MKSVKGGRKMKGGNINESTLFNSNVIGNMSRELVNQQISSMISPTQTIINSDSPPALLKNGGRRKTRSQKKKISYKNKRNGKKRRTTRIY